MNDQSIPTLDWEQAKVKVFPVLRNSAWFDRYATAPNQTPPRKEFLPDIWIVWVLDYPESMRYVSQADLDLLGKSIDDLHQEALINVGHLVSGTYDSVKKPGWAMGKNKNGKFMLSVQHGDGYDTTRFLEPKFNQNPFTKDPGLLGEKFVIGIPTQDYFIAVPFEEAAWLAPLVKADFEKGPRPLSPKVILATKEGYSYLD